MRQFTLTTVCVGALVACVGIEPTRSVSQEVRRLDAEYDQAWEATLRTLMELGYEIQTMDRKAGTMETEWLAINPDYSATIFVTEREDRYSTCGKPGLGQAYRNKQARLALWLRPIRRGVTGLRVETFFRTQRYTDAPFWHDHPLGDVECGSRGRLEEEVRLQIQLRAISENLERLRRGTP